MGNMLLIDGDVVLYQHSTAVEQEYDWGDDVWTLHSDVREAKGLMDNWLAELKEKLNGTSMVLALSDNNNFRKGILPTYKLHRKKHRKPIAYQPLKKYMESEYKTYALPTLEGDDCLGILGTQSYPGDRIIITIDKDLRTIPGYHYNPQKPEKGVEEVTLKEANYNHLYQTLTGDSVDGYKGCPGVGPVTAKRILKDPTWGAVVSAFEGAGLNEKYALIQAQVARILRWGEYNMTTKEALLWKPEEVTANG
jgi:DNA polymerase-1